MNIRSLAVVLVLAASTVLAASPVLAADSKAPAFPAGYRAVALPFPSHQLAFIEPGDRVDILVTFTAEMGDKDKTRQEEVTATIMQNVVVRAVNHQHGVVQILFNPNEAQYAALFAAKDKTLWLSKRAAGDTEMHPMEMANARKLFR
ncbi:MAG: RcpC/CpaB family pilus assembly protein [Elusimicrobiota bacterium]|nr:RcpC/CpaB family pilus assembly protein [Elusimicrobiota bacterium]